ncbi:MAG: hypothetical protein A2787_09635 [Omnitrophica WOR_2 bacterium RIFCSPHIGHO2_01_FULL_48_9]|nr:MAG: hypothetical protein A3D10_07185 [Omnitrophica WOR_2 bacterium RIFCSPHIGHO2_02_FULL_48_11]OGX30000.1 MAG: hypothetical protein A2787_09635 [Omnitrophica WOR_2 bacterium RIFCSPHIGHO2_01_FULL_48_9]
MHHHKTIFVIGTIEILIGGLTLLATIVSLSFSFNAKSPNVLIFVIVSAAVSTFIGIGIIRHRKLAYQLLIYFSSVVLLSKILIFMGIIELNGSLETFFSASLKNEISALYHAFVIFYLLKHNVKQFFKDERFI